jgi:nitrogen fixation protein NifU and related proteins
MTEELSPEHYSATLIDHFERPRNAGAMDGAHVETFVTNPVCGDSLRLFLRFERTQEGDRVAAASFLSSGCPASIATSSVATEMLTGMPVTEADGLTREDFAEAVGGLPASKMHCSVLAAAAVRNALAEWRGRSEATQ